MSKTASVVVDSGTHAGIHVPVGDFCSILEAPGSSASEQLDHSENAGQETRVIFNQNEFRPVLISHQPTRKLRAPAFMGRVRWRAKVLAMKPIRSRDEERPISAR